jgi:Polyphosphate kinase 2 (PPK2)
MMLRTCWLEVGNQAQARRIEARIAAPLRQWKLSSTDLELRRRWYDYSRARNHRREVTDTAQAPWSLEFLRRAPSRQGPYRRRRRERHGRGGGPPEGRETSPPLRCQHRFA